MLHKAFSLLQVWPLRANESYPRVVLRSSPADTSGVGEVLDGQADGALVIAGAGDDYVVSRAVSNPVAALGDEGNIALDGGDLQMESTLPLAVHGNDRLVLEAPLAVGIGGHGEDTIYLSGLRSLSCGDSCTASWSQRNGSFVLQTRTGSQDRDLLFASSTELTVLIGGGGSDGLTAMGAAALLFGDAATVSRAAGRIAFASRSETSDVALARNGVAAAGADELQNFAQFGLSVGGFGSDRVEAAGNRTVLFGGHAAGWLDAARSDIVAESVPFQASAPAGMRQHAASTLAHFAALIAGFDRDVLTHDLPTSVEAWSLPHLTQDDSMCSSQSAGDRFDYFPVPCEQQMLQGKPVPWGAPAAAAAGPVTRSRAVLIGGAEQDRVSSRVGEAAVCGDHCSGKISLLFCRELTR